MDNKFEELLFIITEGAFSRSEYEKTKKYAEQRKDIVDKIKSSETKDDKKSALKEYSRLNTKQTSDDASLYGRGKRYHAMYFVLQNKIDDLMKLKKSGKISEKQEKELKTAIDKMKEVKDKWMSLHSGSPVKESTDELKLNIYESCYNEEITEDERNLLLSFIE